MQDMSWQALLSMHWRKLLGCLVGLIFAMLVLRYGLWNSLFILACMGVGLFIGWRLDLGKDLGSLVRDLFSTGKRR